ncbi:MAG: bifunctional folylpolyglutamate synthase/dihydrofolate synthase [Prevotellaceae bacterium]|jgi:dihydrofolate synthase/folylpolyglutamate synthase|nr:bifunctional folylpolyglutamate synthase/dihydrofolate synthase [Prevotellaceae bacterium]
MNYSETIQYLYDALPVFHRIGKAAYKGGLDNSLALDNYFGNPHTKYRTVHIAGTNGKGSVSHILASVLQAAGYKTGLYTSPHLFDFRERIKIDGCEIPEQAVVDFVAASRTFVETLRPSFFELASSMAFRFFANEMVDIAVIETGLGGRLDSTNIIVPALGVITNTGFDHTEFLGNTLKSIAGEKAGIIKPSIPTVIGEKHVETTAVFIDRAKENRSPLFFAEENFAVRSVEKTEGQQVFNIEALNEIGASLYNSRHFSVSLDMQGDYQQKNIVTALLALAVMRNEGFNIDTEAIDVGMKQAAAKTGLKGRWQILGNKPAVICDTGHNAHGISQTMRQLAEMPCNNLYFVFGVMGDKDLSSIIPLLPAAAHYFYTQASVPRAMNAEYLAAKCTEAGLKGTIVPRISDAVHQAIAAASPDDVVFIGGSTYVVGEVLQSFNDADSKKCCNFAVEKND